MIKKEKLIKDNVVNFPSKLTDLEKEIEAVIFAAAEPLDVDTIENKVSKKSNVVKSLEKLQNEYSNRGINLVCIKNNNNDASYTINITHNVYISHNITYITN